MTTKLNVGDRVRVKPTPPDGIARYGVVIGRGARGLIDVRVNQQSCLYFRQRDLEKVAN